MSEETTEHSSTKVYLTVFGALAVLTGLTVGVSYLHFARPMAIGVALFIAALKVSLIAAFFMHLKHEKRIIHMVLYTAVFLVLFLLCAVLPDIAMR